MKMVRSPLTLLGAFALLATAACNDGNGPTDVTTGPVDAQVTYSVTSGSTGCEFGFPGAFVGRASDINSNLLKQNWEMFPAASPGDRGVPVNVAAKTQNDALLTMQPLCSWELYGSTTVAPRVAVSFNRTVSTTAPVQWRSPKMFVMAMSAVRDCYEGECYLIPADTVPDFYNTVDMVEQNGTWSASYTFKRPGNHLLYVEVWEYGVPMDIGFRTPYASNVMVQFTNVPTILEPVHFTGLKSELSVERPLPVKNMSPSTNRAPVPNPANVGYAGKGWAPSTTH